ncbi:hypothetical protein N7508_010145 [Penicillium antarcticum]|uniref:uncharacterized protein n=1 Tax=Penicillium antarcticum TaxID=416450 RepID=UPI00239DF35A|nr:uncharacterized protein N7508_010145 [Penicillium antarcticum]KAJ5295324.1 hypothetical protein N7508_010145 [Penicillium antarcticum]
MSSNFETLRKKRYIINSLNNSTSILDYRFNEMDFVLPTWVHVPAEVRNGLADIRKKVMVTVTLMKQLMLIRNNRFFEICPTRSGALHQVHVLSVKRLLEWKERWDQIDPTLSVSVKIPCETLRFCVDEFAYARFTTDYTEKIHTLMSGAFQQWRAACHAVSHLSCRLMVGKEQDYLDWRKWFDGEFTAHMREWENCLKGLVLPTWEEVIDDLFLMIHDRVEDAEELAETFYIRGADSPCL